MSWSKKYKRSIDCNNPKGFSQRAHCQGRKKKMNEDLRNWFDPNHPEGGWKRYNTKGEAVGSCAREEGESKPKCLSNRKASQLRSQGGAKAIANAVRRKRRTDPVANRRGKGGKPIMSSNKIKEEMETVRYCPKCQKNETQKECKYGPSFWAMNSIPPMLTTNQMKFDIAQVHPANEEKDHEHSMARSELSKIMNAAKRLKKKMGKGEGNIEAWVQSKITRAADYIDTAADYLDSGEHDVKENCWTGYKRKKGTKKFSPGSCVKEENKPTNPKLWAKWKAKAKSKFDVYPSAYANGWAAKGYKSEGGGWKTVSEGTFGAGVGFDISPGHRGAQKTQKIYNKAIKGAGTEKEWLKKTGPQLPLAKKKSEMQTAGYEPEGEQIYEYSNWRQDLGEDWQKVNRKDKTDGLSQKAVDAYRSENPGSKLQTAVTEKKPTGKRAQRRKNFCSRMSGMKKRLTSAETARDPDSRINKALRRWRCS
jgi:hypothetical protein